MNVAPTDLDVWDPAAFVGSTHVTPVERRAHAALLEAGGLVDAYRAVHPDEGPEAHTWWDYRAGAYHKRQGLRIDNVLLSAGPRRSGSRAPTSTACIARVRSRRITRRS